MKKKGCSFYMAKYSIDFKEKVVKYFKSNGISDTLRVYNISATAVYKWTNQSKCGEFMRKLNKKYTIQDKLEIIAYSKANGPRDTEMKFNISHSVFNKWERIFHEEGSEALGIERRGKKSNKTKKDVNKDKDLLEENRLLRMENDYLKKLKALVEKREDQERKSK